MIEDAAQSFGASYKGKKACSLSDVAATSFFPAKPFGCYGDGGMIFTDDDGMYERLLSIRVHGQGTDKYNNVRIGINGRLDTMQAAVMLAKLPLFDGEMRLRQTVAERYGRDLGGTVKVPVVREHNVSAWAQYTLRHSDRDKMLRKLKDANVPSAVYYPKPLHLQDAFRHLGHGEGDFPVSEEASRQVFSVPMHPYLSEKEQEQVVRALKG